MSWYLMERGWMDHPALQDRKREPFTRREAWCWLIENAAFKTIRVCAGSSIVELMRGQLTASLRQLGDAWRWDHLKVRRFLDVLVLERMAETSNETGQTIITICNYNKYQFTPPTTETARETKKKQQRNSNETDIKEVEQGYIYPPDGANAPSSPQGELRVVSPLNPKRSDRATRIPEDWQPTDEDREFAVSLGLDPDTVTPEFRDYWQGEGGARARKVDWSKTFRNRCRDLARRMKPNAQRKRTPVENLYLGGLLAVDELGRREAQRAARESGSGQSPALTLLDGGRSVAS